MKEIFQAIDNEHDKMISLLEEWVNINSYSENLNGLAKMASAISKQASSLNAPIEEIPLKPKKRIDSKGNIIESAVGNALFIKKNPKAKTQVLLAGHYDTVYPLDSPFQKATIIEDGKMQGPGVADMKGGLIIMLKALEILELSPYAGQLGFEVIINPDEEIGSQGSEHLFKRASINKVAGLIFEPAFSDGAFVSSRKGSANYTLVVRGKSAHAGRDFEKGSSAITAIAKFIQEAHTLNDFEKGITINFGSIQGGGPVNIVPDLCICQINVRVLTINDLKNVKSAFHTLLKKYDAKDNINMVLHEIGERAPKPIDEKTTFLFNLLKKVGADLNTEIHFRMSGGVCDGNILSSVGLPTIDTLGVIGGNLHTIDEYALLDSLNSKLKLTVYLLIEIIKSHS